MKSHTTKSGESWETTSVCGPGFVKASTISKTGEAEFKSALLYTSALGLPRVSWSTPLFIQNQEDLRNTAPALAFAHGGQSAGEP